MIDYIQFVSPDSSCAYDNINSRDQDIRSNDEFGHCDTFHARATCCLQVYPMNYANHLIVTDFFFFRFISLVFGTILQGNFHLGLVQL